jgi:hypothetical protein
MRSQMWLLRRVRLLALRGVDVAVSVSVLLESDRHVVPIGVGVAKSRLSSVVPGAIVARYLCDFLTTLAVACLGFVVVRWVPPMLWHVLSVWCWFVVFGIFVRITLWSHVLARVGVIMLLPVLGLDLAMWVCGFDHVAVDFCPIFS